MPSCAPELCEIADGIHAYLQPDGGWGLSNSGLISGKADQLLVDTLFDLRSTSELFRQLSKVASFSPAEGLVVNTHANGDHCYGNPLVTSGRIIASERSRDEMRDMPAGKLHRLTRAARFLRDSVRTSRLTRALAKAMGLQLLVDFIDAAPYVAQIFEPFDFRDIPVAEPTQTFTGQLRLSLGDRDVELLELGPAHTEGDVVAFDPQTKTLFTGDLLFMGCHPLAWAGTPSSCIQALEKLMTLSPEVVVPGHGPLTDRRGILDHIAYFEALREAARPLHAAKVKPEPAAKELMHRGFGARALPERLYVNVAACYREFEAISTKLSPITAMGAMSRLSREATLVADSPS